MFSRTHTYVDRKHCPSLFSGKLWPSIPPCIRMRSLSIFLFLALVLLGLFSLSLADDAKTVTNDGTVISDPVNAAAASAESTTQKSSKQRRRGINKKTINSDALEKAWESGDDEVELEHEFEVNRRVGAKVQSKRLNLDDPTSIQKLFKKDPLASAGLSGSTVMMFVELKTTQPNGKPWTKDDVEKLAGRWASLMRSGSVSCTVYNISGDDLKQPRLLMNVDKGWTTSDVIRFALQQPETIKVTKDNRDYTPEEYGEVEDD